MPHESPTAAAWRLWCKSYSTSTEPDKWTIRRFSALWYFTIDAYSTELVGTSAAAIGAYSTELLGTSAAATSTSCDTISAAHQLMGSRWCGRKFDALGREEVVSRSKATKRT